MSARPCHLSGRGRRDFTSRRRLSTRTDNSLVLVRNNTPLAPTMSPTSQPLNASYDAPSGSCCRNNWIWPVRSEIFAKLALPMIRLNRMRPPTCTRVGLASSQAASRSPNASCNWPARASRRKSLGNALAGTAPLLLSLLAPTVSRNCASFARRSAMSLFSSTGGWSPGTLFELSVMMLDTGLQGGLQKLIEIAVQHGRGVTHFHASPQILDTGLVEHVGTNLVAPAHVGLGVLEDFGRRVALVDFELVELGLQHLHCGGTILVLAAFVLARDHDPRGHVRNSHGRLGLVDMLTTRAGGAVDIGFQVS